MTGYYISVGYNSSYKKPEVARELVKVVGRIRKTPSLIIDEALRVEKEFSAEHLESFAEMYKEPGVPGRMKKAERKNFQSLCNSPVR